MAAPILLVGDRGMLGRAFRESLDRSVRAYQGFDLPDFDASSCTSEMLLTGLPLTDNSTSPGCTPA